MNKIKKEKIWFLTKQNSGSKVNTFDVWNSDPRKAASWNPRWKVYVMKEISLNPRDKKESGR